MVTSFYYKGMASEVWSGMEGTLLSSAEISVSSTRAATIGGLEQALQVRELVRCVRS